MVNRIALSPSKMQKISTSILEHKRKNFSPFLPLPTTTSCLLASKAISMFFKNLLRGQNKDSCFSFPYSCHQSMGHYNLLVDGSVAFIDVGAGKSLDTVNVKDPIVAFMFGQKGLMANVTIEGAKFTKLVR
jgi:hypothetical protein